MLSHEEPMWNSNTSIENYILEKKLENKTKELNQAKTPYEKLLVAATYGDLNLAKELIDQKTPVNPEPLEIITTPLFCAARKGHFEMVKFLVENNANVNQPSKGNHGNTPLMVAIACGHVEVVAYLVLNKANVNYITVNKQSVLEVAFDYAKKNHFVTLTLKMISILLDANIFLNIGKLSFEERFTNLKWDLVKTVILTNEEASSLIEGLEKIFSDRLSKPFYRPMSYDNANHLLTYMGKNPNKKVEVKNDSEEKKVEAKNDSEEKDDNNLPPTKKRKL